MFGAHCLVQYIKVIKNKSNVYRVGLHFILQYVYLHIQYLVYTPKKVLVI